MHTSYIYWLYVPRLTTIIDIIYMYSYVVATFYINSSFNSAVKFEMCLTCMTLIQKSVNCGFSLPWIRRNFLDIQPLTRTPQAITFNGKHTQKRVALRRKHRSARQSLLSYDCRSASLATPRIALSFKLWDLFTPRHVHSAFYDSVVLHTYHDDPTRWPKRYNKGASTHCVWGRTRRYCAHTIRCDLWQRQNVCGTWRKQAIPTDCGAVPSAIPKNISTRGKDKNHVWDHLPDSYRFHTQASGPLPQTWPRYK